MTNSSFNAEKFFVGLMILIMLGLTIWGEVMRTQIRSRGKYVLAKIYKVSPGHGGTSYKILYYYAKEPIRSNTREFGSRLEEGNLLLLEVDSLKPRHWELVCWNVPAGWELEAQPPTGWSEIPQDLRQFIKTYF